MRILKFLAVALIAVFGLLVVAAVLLVILFDPNDYKDEITALLEERTGRSVEIADDIEWSLFPWLAIETGGITIGNHPDFGERPFATVESVSARVRVWPLLRREVELGLIAVDGVELNLGVDADGNPNWSDLTGTSVQPDAGDEAPAAAGSRLASLEIQGIRITDGRILWREAEEVRYVISDLSIATGEITLGDPLDVELALSALEVATQRTVVLNLETIATIRTDRTQLIELGADLSLRDANGVERAMARLQTDAVTIMGASSVAVGTGTIEGSAVEPPFGPETVDGRVAWAGLEVDLAAGTFGADGLTTSANGVTANWQIAASGLPAAPTLTGRMNLDPAPAERLLALAGISLPAGIDATTLGNVTGSAAFTATPGGDALAEEFQLGLLGFSLTGSARLDSESTLTGTIAVPAFGPNETLLDLLTAYLPEEADASVIDSIALSASFSASGGDTGSTLIDDLELRINSATLAGDVEIAGGPGNPTYRGNLAAADVAPTLVAGLLGARLAGGLEPDAIGTVTARTDFVFVERDDTLALDNFSARAFGLSATGNATVNSATSAPVVRGRAAIATFDPRAVLTRFDQPVPQTSDPGAFTAAAFTSDFVIDSAHGEFRDLTVTLDGSPITGSFRVDDFESPSYRFDLRTETLNVDRYLPPDSDEAADGQRTAGDIELASEPLELLDLTGTARVGDLTLAGLKFQQVEATLTIAEGRATIEPARSRLYGGEFSGALVVDTTGELPSMRLTGEAVSLALEPFLTALIGESSIRGTGNFNVDLEGVGRTVTATLHTAAGTMSFALSDGAITGFNVGRTLCAAYNLREGLAQPARAANETSFQLIRAGADVTDGIATSTDLLARTGYMDITGSGRMSLADTRLDYNMVAALTAAVPIANCETMNEFVGDSIPFTIKGPLSGPPEIEPDLRKLIRSRIQEEVRENVEDRLRERLQDRLRDLL